MTFKEVISQDTKRVFLNTLEFADKHVIDGKEMNVSVDDNEQVEREKRYKSLAQGLYTKQLLFYVAAEEYGSPPLIGRRMNFDDEYYTVTEVINENGIYSISLEANES